MTSRNLLGSIAKSLLAAVFAVCITVGSVGCAENQSCCQGASGKPCCAKKESCAKKPCAKTCTKATAAKKPASVKDSTKKSNVEK